MPDTKCRVRLPFGEAEIEQKRYEDAEAEVERLKAHLKTLYGDYASDTREILSWYAATLADTRDELATLRVAVKAHLASYHDGGYDQHAALTALMARSQSD